MGKRERKIKREMDGISLGVFLSRLAAEFSNEKNGTDSDLAGISEDLRKLEIKIKPYGGFFKVKLKAEQNQAQEARSVGL